MVPEGAVAQEDAMTMIVDRDEDGNFGNFELVPLAESKAAAAKAAAAK